MNKYNPKIHHRRSIRLKGYDYSKAGAYFITTCCYHMTCLFGEVIDGTMILNDAGEMVHAQWLALKERFPNIELHEFVVMPNHFHGIINITSETDVKLNVKVNDVAIKTSNEDIDLNNATVEANDTAVGATLVVAIADEIIDVVDKDIVKIDDDVDSVENASDFVQAQVQVQDEHGEGNHEGLPRRDSLLSNFTALNTDENMNDLSEQTQLVNKTIGRDSLLSNFIALKTDSLIENLTDLSEQKQPVNKTIGDMMDAFKSITTVEYIRGVKTLNWPPFNRKVWERNYYEHIIRNQQAYEAISNYIVNNPKKWKQDKFRK